jgi:hypothetical protein
MVASAPRRQAGTRAHPRLQAPYSPVLRPVLCSPYARGGISTSQSNAAVAIWRTLRMCNDPVDTPMLDLGFILIGAGFLGACILYALVCERL